MTQSEMIAAHIAAHGVTVCPPGAVSKNIKFKIEEDEIFAYWELGGWFPGEHSEMRWPAHAGGSAFYDMREWNDAPNMVRGAQLAAAITSRHPSVYEL